MAEDVLTQEGRAPLDEDLVDFAQTIADQVESFLIAGQAVSRGEEGGAAVPLLLRETSQLLLAGARLGMQVDFELQEEYEPDAGPDPDLDAMRHRLGVIFEDFDAFTVVFDPYAEIPDIVPSLLSGKRALVSTATKNLQDQLFLRDLPRLRAALQVPVSIALLKGRSSYLCLHRMKQARQSEALPDRWAARTLAKIEAWSTRTA